jgi:hypothetical protein
MSHGFAVATGTSLHAPSSIPTFPLAEGEGNLQVDESTRSAGVNVADT